MEGSQSHAPHPCILRLGPLLALMLGIRCAASAHEKPSYAVHGVDERMTVSVPGAETPPTIDGKLADGEWARAAKLTDFRCVSPDHGVLATLPTTVYLLAGEGHLYIAFECGIESPAKLLFSETREDASLRGQDRVSILLDTLHDHRRVIELTVNPRGARYDARWGNSEWDAVWDLATAINADCYIIEINLDLGSLTYERGSGNTIGANFLRYSQQPDEDTGWAVDERSTVWNWQVPKYPHLTGLLFPQRPTQRAARADAFAVLIRNWDSGGSLLANQGVDIEYPVTPSATSRFVLFPDFSEVEAAYETIDVSYREQFLPETRDFFIHQAEFFGDRSLFHSRRIEDFDYGAKMTGAFGRHCVGALDTYDPDTDRNDFVAHVTRELGRHADSSLSLVDVREPGFSNTVVAAELRTDFEEDSLWRSGFEHARSWSSDSAREGHRTEAYIGYNMPRLGGATLSYDSVSENFDPIDGFNPRMGFRRLDLNAWKVWEAPQGKRFYHEFEVFGGHGRGWTSDGAFYARDSRVGVVFWWDPRSRILVQRRHERHLEDDIRPEPFDDRTTAVRAEVGRDRDLSASGSFTFGDVEDSRLRQIRLGTNWRSRSGDVQASLNYSRRRQNFLDGTRERARIVDLNLTRVFDPEHWLAIRWFTRSGDEDIENASLVYRIHRRSGKEVFFILGDPQADHTSASIAVKYIHPFSF